LAVVVFLWSTASANTGRNPFRRTSESDEVDCPPAPVKPDVGENCNWIPLMDTRNCIRKYACEPKLKPLCGPAPQFPEDSDRCDWVALKDSNGCVVDYHCVPRKSSEKHEKSDSSNMCCYWAANGECDVNPVYMRSYCQGSCSHSGCSDGFDPTTCLSELSRGGCGFGRRA